MQSLNVPTAAHNPCVAFKNLQEMFHIILLLKIALQNYFFCLGDNLNKLIDP